MGPGRSLIKLAEIEVDGMRATEQRLCAWSRAYGWVQKAREYDEEQLERKRQARQDAIDKMNEAHIKIALEQQTNAVAQIQALINAGQFRDSATVQLLKLALDLERLARGAALDHTKVELTGKDDGPVDVVVETFWGRGTDPRKRTESSEQVEEESEDDDDFDEEDDENQ